MKLLFFNIIMWFVVSCNPTQKVVPMNASFTFSGNFVVFNLYQKAITEKQPTLHFDFKTKKVSGNAACNSYGGDYSVSESNNIQFGMFRKTEIYCDEPVMVTEKAFFKALSETQKFDIKNNVLTLYNTEGIAVLHAKKEQ